MRWIGNCEAAFGKLKELLVTPPVLKVIEPDKPYILQTNAFELGCSASWGGTSSGFCQQETFAQREELLSH